MLAWGTTNEEFGFFLLGVSDRSTQNSVRKKIQIKMHQSSKNLSAELHEFRSFYQNFNWEITGFFFLSHLKFDFGQ